jgi:hypothetical protein
MPTINEVFLKFFQDHNGKLVDIDNYPKGRPFQCVDLIRLYAREALGLPVGTLAPGNAAEIFNKFPHIAGAQYFQKARNIPWNYPKQGDIIFFGSPYGKDVVKDKNGKDTTIYYGHTGIVNTANVWKMTIFEQNYGKDIAPRIAEHDYKGCLGWLSFKGQK